MSKPHPSVAHVLQFFVYEHLPPKLQTVSKPFHDLAHDLAEHLPHSPEVPVCLRKLLEAKDAAVRSGLVPPPKEAPSTGFRGQLGQ